MSARPLVATLWLALLAACGGGGDAGNSGFTPPTNDFAVLAGYQRLMDSGGSWSVSGTGSDGLAYSATFAFAPAAAAVFPVSGATLARTLLTSSSRQGSNTPQNVTAEFFREADARIQGARYSVGSTTVCSRSTAAALPSVQAKVGTGGALVTLDDLAGCASTSALDGSTTTTWSLAFERGIVMLCLDSVGRNAANAFIGSESDCVEMAADGTLGTRARVSIVQPGGFSLTMKNF